MHPACKPDCLLSKTWQWRRTAASGAWGAKATPASGCVTAAAELLLLSCYTGLDAASTALRVNCLSSSPASCSQLHCGAG